MKKRPSYKDLKRKADDVRRKELVLMEKNKPKTSASDAFNRKPYQTIGVLDYLDKKKG